VSIILIKLSSILYKKHLIIYIWLWYKNIQKS